MVSKKKRARRRVFLWIALVLLAGGSVNIYLALRPDALEARLRSVLEALFLHPEFEDFEDLIAEANADEDPEEPAPKPASRDEQKAAPAKKKKKKISFI